MILTGNYPYNSHFNLWSSEIANNSASAYYGHWSLTWKNFNLLFHNPVELLAHNHFHCYVMKDAKFG